VRWLSVLLLLSGCSYERSNPPTIRAEGLPDCEWATGQVVDTVSVTCSSGLSECVVCYDSGTKAKCSVFDPSNCEGGGD